MNALALLPATATSTRPVLRWHGGKWRLAPWIISFFGPHRCYVEPYGGAASVLLRKARSYAEVYGDLDSDVVNMFRVLRDPAAAARLVRLIEMTPFAREEFLAAYEHSENPIEAARRLIVRSFMGHGSNGHAPRTGFRANSNRSGTTPAHDWMNLPPALAQIAERMLGVVLENRDAKLVMAAHDEPTTLHFADPPYLAKTRDSGADYRHEMTDAEHGELLAFLGTLKGMVILSGYPSPLYDAALAGWRRVEKAAMADGALHRTECLWLNPAALAASPQGVLPFGSEWHSEPES
jgi:DNA adenine methylase